MEQLNPQKQLKEKQPIIYRVTAGSLAKDTKVSYQRYINQFLAHFKIVDVDIVRDWSPKLARQHLIDYVIFLRDVKQFPRSSINLQCHAIRYLFYMIMDDDTRIDMTKVRMEYPPDERTHRDRAYTTEEIQTMLTKGCSSRTREKVMVLLLTSTGMRIGALHTLKIGDLSPKETQYGGRVYNITVYSYSSNHSYLTPCNLECAQAIDAYLHERTDAGEILKDESPLLRNLYTSLTVKRVKPLTYDNVRYLVSRIVRTSGIRKAFQFKGEAKRALGFRKYYKTKAEQSGMKSINVEVAHGHSIGVSDHYYRPAESDILEDYMTHAADALTIDPTQRLQKKVQELESEQAQEIDRQSREIITLKTQVSKLAQDNAKRRFIKADKDGYFEIDMKKLNEIETQIKSVKTWLKKDMSPSEAQTLKYCDD